MVEEKKKRDSRSSGGRKREKSQQCIHAGEGEVCEGSVEGRRSLRSSSLDGRRSQWMVGGVSGKEGGVSGKEGGVSGQEVRASEWCDGFVDGWCDGWTLSGNTGRWTDSMDGGRGSWKVRGVMTQLVRQVDGESGHWTGLDGGVSG